MVFNAAMRDDNATCKDAELITKLGGPKAVAELLGYTKPGSVQRVYNWKSRGIPDGVKVQFPQHFMVSADSSADQPRTEGASA